jgi:mannose-6-phosphate isomerase-like protein (cupin superfamily)
MILRPGAESLIEEGCFITELSNSAADPEVSIARARVPPGVTTRWHRVKDTVERYVILEGTGRVEVGTRTSEDVRPGDVVLIPGSERQRITNTGEGDLIFLAICTPRFRPEAYEDIS